MSLDRSKLQKLRELGNGGCQAQCPACAETGQDRKGEHLRIAADGKFGCCVFPGDRKHRSRIFALAGERSVNGIRVRVASAKTGASVQVDLLGRLGRVFGSPVRATEGSVGNAGTLGTAFQYPRAYAKDDSFIHTLKGSEEPVPSVPVLTTLPSAGCDRSGEGMRLPYLTESGDLVIPFNSPERYHWWKGGQSVDATKQEILEREESDASRF